MNISFSDFLDFVQSMSIGEIVIASIIWIILGMASGIAKLFVNYIGGTAISSSFGVSQRASEYAVQLKESTASSASIKKVVDDLLEEIGAAIATAQEATKGWADNFLKQVIGSHEEYKGQKVLGSLIELILLAAFVYADAAQGVNNLSVLLGIQEAIPDWLKDIIVPIVVSSAGTVFIVGMFIGDILGATHLSYWEDLKDDTRRIYLRLLIIMLVLAVILNGGIALSRVRVLEESITWVTAVGNWAQSLLLIPLLLATFLLFRGVFGFFVLLAIFLNLFYVVLSTVKYSIKIIMKLSPLVTGSETIARWLLLFALTIVQGFFGLLGALLKGMMFGLLAIVALVFFLPYLLVNAPIKKFSGQTIEEHLLEFIQPQIFNPHQKDKE